MPEGRPEQTCPDRPCAAPAATEGGTQERWRDLRVKNWAEQTAEVTSAEEPSLVAVGRDQTLRGLVRGGETPTSAVPKAFTAVWVPEGTVLEFIAFAWKGPRKERPLTRRPLTMAEVLSTSPAMVCVGPGPLTEVPVTTAGAATPNEPIRAPLVSSIVSTWACTWIV